MAWWSLWIYFLIWNKRSISPKFETSKIIITVQVGQEEKLAYRISLLPRNYRRSWSSSLWAAIWTNTYFNLSFMWNILRSKKLFSSLALCLSVFEMFFLAMLSHLKLCDRENGIWYFRKDLNSEFLQVLDKTIITHKFSVF